MVRKEYTNYTLHMKMYILILKKSSTGGGVIKLQSKITLLLVRTTN